MDFLGFYDRAFPNTATAVTISKTAAQVGRPYPEFFKTPVGANPEMKTTSTLTSWQSSKKSGKIARCLADRSAKVNLNKMHRFEEAGLEQDELTEVVEDLVRLAENYEPSSDAY